MTLITVLYQSSPAFAAGQKLTLKYGSYQQFTYELPADFVCGWGPLGSKRVPPYSQPSSWEVFIRS